MARQHNRDMSEWARDKMRQNWSRLFRDKLRKQIKHEHDRTIHEAMRARSLSQFLGETK